MSCHLSVLCNLHCLMTVDLKHPEQQAKVRNEDQTDILTIFRNS